MSVGIVPIRILSWVHISASSGLTQRCAARSRLGSLCVWSSIMCVPSGAVENGVEIGYDDTILDHIWV